MTPWCLKDMDSEVLAVSSEVLIITGILDPGKQGNSIRQNLTFADD